MALKLYFTLLLLVFQGYNSIAGPIDALQLPNQNETISLRKLLASFSDNLQTIFSNVASRGAILIEQSINITTLAFKQFNSNLDIAVLHIMQHIDDNGARAKCVDNALQNLEMLKMKAKDIYFAYETLVTEVLNSTLLTNLYDQYQSAMTNISNLDSHCEESSDLEKCIGDGVFQYFQNISILTNQTEDVFRQYNFNLQNGQNLMNTSLSLTNHTVVFKGIELVEEFNKCRLKPSSQ